MFSKAAESEALCEAGLEPPAAAEVTVAAGVARAGAGMTFCRVELLDADPSLA